jgi:hypothetical protein
VRSVDEIFATLDARGSLKALPFMPEMLKYSGQRFRVSRRAIKRRSSRPLTARTGTAA